MKTSMFHPPRSIMPLLLIALLLPGTGALAQLGNGKLQIHQIDVGQGDAALIVSPLGQLAIVDDGDYSNCAPFVNYLTGLGVADFDYNFASHYHADHIGCLDDLLAAGVVLNVAGYDRGSSYSSATYTSYVNALGNKRQTIRADQTITLDAGSPEPVVIRCMALNGAGVYSGSDENAKSVVLRLSYGDFDAVLGGDLSGDLGVEAAVGPLVGDVEVYKVHHHGSATSSYDAWLSATTPEVGLISVGSNTYGHPTAAALDRLHARGVKTYWTERGSGASPAGGWDKVGGTILIQADPGVGAAYTVSGSGFTDTYYNSGGGGGGNLTKTYYPSSVTMLTGTVGGGSYASLGADDGGYLQVNGGKVGKKFATDWYGRMVVAETPISLTVDYNGHYSASGTQTLYLYNFSTSAWSQIDAATVGTSDVTRTCVISSPAAFVSATGEIRARVYRGSASRTYNCYGDLLSVTIEYQGAAKLAAANPPRDDGPGARGSTPPLAATSFTAWPNPFNPRVQISFELAEATHGRLRVFDVTGRQVAVLADGQLERGLNVFVWSGTDSRNQPLSSGVFLATLETVGAPQTLKLVMLR